MRKILFLDVDGVLNSHATGGRYALKRRCLQRLQHIVEETGCEIVLSSTWRKDEYALRRLRRVLAYRKIKIIGMTPVEPGGIHGVEIANWCADHLYETDEPFVIAILDDDSDMLEYQLKNFFQTDGQYGLTDTIAYRVIYHLNNGPLAHME